jgi:hypothetical protein
MADVTQLLTESRLPLRTAAAQEGRSYRTLLRWIDAGVQGVFLESFRQGGRRFTTREALSRFVERMTNRPHVLTADEAARRAARIEASMARIKFLHAPSISRRPRSGKQGNEATD